jgi:multimeric flavodoxin WrbA
MKLLGLACGRKMGNCEILLKEALMGAEELGVEVEIIRLLDLNIKPCIHCLKCPRREEGVEACIIKDDSPFLWNKVMDCDGLIISAPVYSLTPPGYFLTVRDRVFSSKADVAFAMEYKKAGGKDVRFGTKAHVDERLFKVRPGALISIGGAPYSDWVAFALPLLNSFTFSLQIDIVDQMQLIKIAAPGAVLLNEEAMKKGQKLGRNVAEAMGKPSSEIKFKGDDPGICPVCHLNVMVMGKKSTVLCPICGIKGTLKIIDGEINVDFPEKEQRKSHLTLEGKRLHFWEIGDVAKEFMPRMGQITPKLDKYKSYKSYTRPPSKSAKNS